MGIVYRHQKELPLTIEEMDGNFAHLDERLRSLESAPPLGEGIAKVSQEGDQLIVEGTFGTSLGQVTLPKVFPNPCGKWEQGRAYRLFDWVQYAQGVYSCSTPHESEDFETDQAKWSLVFEVSPL